MQIMDSRGNDGEQNITELNWTEQNRTEPSRKERNLIKKLSRKRIKLGERERRERGQKMIEKEITKGINKQMNTVEMVMLDKTNSNIGHKR